MNEVSMIVGMATRRCGVRDYAAALCAALPAETVRLVEVPTPTGHVFRHQLGPLWRARRAAGRVGRDLASSLVHVQYSDFSWNGVRPFEDLYEVFTRHCPGPLVVTLHEHPWFRDDHRWDQPQTAADRAFRWLAAGSREVLLRHQGLHVHHRWQADTLSRGGVPDERLHVAPYPIPPPATGGSPEEFRARFALGGKCILAMTGFIFERKRADRALAVLPLLPDDVVLCLLGGANGAASEAHLGDLRQQARQFGVAGRLVVTGYLPVTDLAAGLDAADVLLAPYQEVTSSASVADAISRGVPVLASDVASFREMEGAGAGLECAETSSPQAFQAAVRRVLDNPAHAADLRARNKAYAERHSVTRFAATLLKWYEAAIGHGAHATNN